MSIAGGVDPRPLAPHSFSRARFTRVLVDFRKEKEKQHLRAGLGSSGEFQGCFGGIAECSMLRTLVHSRHK